MINFTLNKDHTFYLYFNQKSLLASLPLEGSYPEWTPLQSLESLSLLAAAVLGPAGTFYVVNYDKVQIYNTIPVAAAVQGLVAAAVPGPVAAAAVPGPVAAAAVP